MYATEGKWVDAGLSAASMIPFAGYGANAAKMGINGVKKIDPKIVPFLKENAKKATEKTVKKTAAKTAKKPMKRYRAFELERAKVHSDCKPQVSFKDRELRGGKGSTRPDLYNAEKRIIIENKSYNLSNAASRRNMILPLHQTVGNIFMTKESSDTFFLML